MQLAELTPLKKSKHLARISVAFADTETFGTKSDVFRCGSIAYLKQGKERVQTLWTIEELFQYCQRFDVVYFYNVQFDSAFFRNYAFKNNLQETLIESGNKILGCAFYEFQPKSKKLLKLFTLKDMLQFSGSPPCSLKICAADYGITLKKFDVDFDNCSDNDIKRHCETDAILLLKFAYLCRKIYWDNYNVDIFHKKIYSVPAVAVKVFRSNFLKTRVENPFARIVYESNARGHYKINTKLFDFCKDAYKGGFCNVFHTELRENELSYDISSAYPFAMSALRFPVGRPFFTSNYWLWRQKVMKIPSIGRVKALIPPHIGICGIRDNKLVEICGLQTETLTSLEILNIEKNGGKILEFYGIYFDDIYSHESGYQRGPNDILERFERNRFNLIIC